MLDNTVGRQRKSDYFLAILIGKRKTGGFPAGRINRSEYRRQRISVAYRRNFARIRAAGTCGALVALQMPFRQSLAVVVAGVGCSATAC